MRFFFTWVLQHEVCLPDTNAEFDDVVCKFVESCWEEGESKHVTGDFLSALPKYSPHLNRKLSCSWSLYRTWQRHKPPFRCPPFTLQVCMAVAGFMWQKGFRCAVAATLLGFHCVLRSGEMLDAKWCDLALSDDMGTLLLPRTKSGTRFGYPESVIIHDRTLLRLLRRLQLVSPNHRSHAGIVPSHYRRLFAQALQSLGVASLGYQLYSIRRGGATADFHSHGLLDSTAVRGRWADVKTCRIYVNESLALLASLIMDPALQSSLSREATTLQAAVAAYVASLQL